MDLMDSSTGSSLTDLTGDLVFADRVVLGDDAVTVLMVVRARFLGGLNVSSISSVGEPSCEAGGAAVA